MLKTAKDIIEYLNKLGNIEDGFKALMLEKFLEEKKEENYPWLRQISENVFNVGIGNASLDVKRTANNSYNIILTPYN